MYILGHSYKYMYFIFIIHILSESEINFVNPSNRPSSLNSTKLKLYCSLHWLIIQYNFSYLLHASSFKI